METDEDFIYNFTSNMHIQFVKAQDEFIKKECIKHYIENKGDIIFFIDEDKLNHVFDLGIKEYAKELEANNGN